MGAYFRLPLPLFSFIAIEERQSIEIEDYAMTEKELRSSRGALRQVGNFLISYNPKIPDFCKSLEVHL